MEGGPVDPHPPTPPFPPPTPRRDPCIRRWTPRAARGTTAWWRECRGTPAGWCPPCAATCARYPAGRPATPPSVPPSVLPPPCLSLHPSLWVSICPSIHSYGRLSVPSPTPMDVRLSVPPSAPLAVCLSVWPPPPPPPVRLSVRGSLTPLMAPSVRLWVSPSPAVGGRGRLSVCLSALRVALSQRLWVRPGTRPL